MHSKQDSAEMGGSRKRGDVLKDEVYRQMFRLEAGRPGADLELAVALLRAWMALDQTPKTSPDRLWLRQVCPVCIALLESAGGAQLSCNVRQSPQ